MTQLFINNNKSCFLKEDDDKILKQVNQLLSFKLVGIEHTPAYKNHYWDGITYLMKKNQFSLGLLPFVQRFYSQQQIPLEIIDHRIKPEDAVELDITQRLIDLDKVPRDYQIQALDAALKCQRGIIRAVTGSGKTLIAALIAAKLNKPIIIYVIGLDLLQQFHEFFSQVFDEKIGFIGNGRCEIARINIASIWTVGKALGIKSKDILIDNDEYGEEEYNLSNQQKIVQLLKSTKVHILDECHYSSIKTFQSIYKTINPEYIYGLSGTPYREDGADKMLYATIGEIIIDIPASDLIERGYLAQPIIKFYKVPKQSKCGSNYQEIYKNCVVENKVRNDLIVEKTSMLVDKGYTILILFHSIKHGQILYDLLSKKFECAILDGSNSLEERTEIKNKIIKGELKLVLASKIFQTGIDLPPINALVLAGGGKSTVALRQKVGRAIRFYPGKTHAAIIDFIDDVRYLKSHSQIRYRTYLSEKGFIVKWPKQENKNQW